MSVVDGLIYSRKIHVCKYIATRVFLRVLLIPTYTAKLHANSIAALY